MSYFLILFLVQLYQSSDQFLKNCYFYNFQTKILFDCRNSKLFPTYSQFYFYKYNEEEQIELGKLYFDFNFTMNIKECKDFAFEKFSVIFVPEKISEKPCVGLLSSNKNELDLKLEEQQLLLKNKDSPQMTVQLTCSKLVISVEDPDISLENDSKDLLIVSRIFCPSQLNNALFFQKNKIWICFVIFTASILICLNGLFHDNIVKCIIAFLLGYFLVQCGINFYKSDFDHFEKTIINSIAVLTAIFFALCIVQFKKIYRIFIGFVLGTLMSFILVNLVYPLMEEYLMYSTYVSSTLMLIILNIYLAEKVILVEICLIGAFLLVYSLVFFFDGLMAIFDYAVLIKAGNKQEFEQFIVFGAVWVVFLIYGFIQYKIRSKKNQIDFKTENLIF